MLDLLPCEESVEPESLSKELDSKELSKEAKDVKELSEELPEDVNHEREEESDESQAVSVVVKFDGVGAAVVLLVLSVAPQVTANKANAQAVFCIMAK
jgi:endonuclease III